MKSIKRILKIVFLFILFIGFFKSVNAAEEGVKISIIPSNSSVTTSDLILMIDVKKTVELESDLKFAIELLYGEESLTNKWISLENNTNESILEKPYTYVVKQNGKITVRVVSWKNDDKSDLKQIGLQVFTVNNIDKNNPVIENIVTDSKAKSINIEIKAKDNETSVEKYYYECIENGKKDNNNTGKFEINDLESNKEYTIKCIVEDKAGHKVESTKKVKTIAEVVPSNVVENTVINSGNNVVESESPENVATVTLDTTMSNKQLPEVGNKSKALLVVSLIIIGIYIIRTKDRK